MEQTYEEWVKEYYPNTLMQYKISQMTPEELVEKIVIAVSSGFSCGGEGGTVMKIDSITDAGWVHLSPADERAKKANHMGRGWSTLLKELPFKVKLKE